MRAAFTEGWLSAHIETGPGDSVQRSDHNRREQMRQLGQVPPESIVPEGGRYLMDLFLLLGCARHMDMGGMRPIAPEEIVPLAQISGSPLDSWWEVSALVRMSRAFLQGEWEGRSAFSIPPWERLQ